MGRPNRSSRPWPYCGFLFLFLILPISWAFNIETKRPLVHRHTPDTAFGYSIDFYVHEKNKYLLLVGAPFAPSQQSGVTKGGAVFACDVRNQRCSAMSFDTQGNERRLNGSRALQIEDKSHQMFGATVVSSKGGDSVLACAPHYKYFFSKFEVIEPVGACYYAMNHFKEIEEFAPCRQEPARHGHHRFGYGMCGFSAAIPDNGKDSLFISAPGTWYWQGATFSQSITNKTNRPNTPDGPAHTDHHQLGYSTAAGDFDGDGKDDIVVGVPRGNELIGMVAIYTRDLRNIINLTEENGLRGQYFGGSVAVTDLNKDGLDDLIVGSPFYTDYKTVFDVKTQEHKPQYDIGKVTVYIQTGGRSFKEPIQLIGHTQWSRFGYSLAAAGDLNGDGYNDFLVGAPYDGEDGRGAVYVYHGSADGVRKEYTQKIDAKELHPDLKTFGFSLAGARDIDGNDYPDIAVGAMKSSHAVILRTKPVMQVTGNVRTVRKTINLDDKLCTTEFGKMPCEKLTFCLKFNGKLKPENNNVDMKLRVQLDSKNQLSPRAFFSRKDLDRKRGVKVDKNAVSRDQPNIVEQTVTISKGKEHCETFDVYVPDTIRDKISPIIISVNYTHVEKRTTGDFLEPAVDTTLPQSFTTELTVEKDCGEDNVCIPDLQMNAVANRDKFTLGTADTSLVFNVTVRNQGEASYLSQYYVTIPPGFEYGGIEKYQTKQSISCSPSETNKDHKDKDSPYVFVCDIGNPLPANERVDFGIRLTGTNVDTSKDKVEVKMKVNSTINEDPGREKDNEIVISVPMEIKAQLTLVGRSTPEQVDYTIQNRSKGEEANWDFEIGPVVSHLYQIINKGPSAVSASTLDIFWPSYSTNGKHLLYLIDVPYISHPTKAKCLVKQGQNINPASITISNQHVPTASTPIEEEEVEELGDEDEYKKRKRRANARRKQNDEIKRAPRADDRRRLREQNEELKRTVKQAKEAGHAIEYKGNLNRAAFDCGNLNCTQITCDIGHLDADEYVLVEIFSRLWVNTLIDDHGSGFEADISSLAFAQITSLPHVPKFTPPSQVIAVTTDVNPIDTESARGIPWWLILLAILIGLIILALIILCCWRLGFFKRNRPPREKAKLEKGDTNGEYYADSSARYAHPQMYSPERHGARL
uniref:Integrin alpha-2 domain-containing protein n=1 Tax=Acrobeloides nanus TaxID=290746 RepID=A0A914C2S2_9BILA